MRYRNIIKFNPIIDEKKTQQQEHSYKRMNHFYVCFFSVYATQNIQVYRSVVFCLNDTS